MCRKAFIDASIMITSQNGEVTVFIKDKTHDENYEKCFSFEADISYEKYFFISALSGKALNNHHFIYSISAANLDEKVDRDDYERRQKKV